VDHACAASRIGLKVKPPMDSPPRPPLLPQPVTATGEEAGVGGVGLVSTVQWRRSNRQAIFSLVAVRLSVHLGLC